MKHVTLNRCSTALAGRLAPLVLGLAALAAPASAQDAAAPSTAPTPQTESSVADAAAEGDVIVVTGSRISRPDLVSSSPVATLSGDALKATNSVTVEKLLTSNPQFVSAQTGASNNPGDGAATIDLRGLGSNRTLVLIDGKRAPIYDSTGSVDVNTIPTALIKRIDILTGGASAVYGSDAISGVVNFILDERFEGLRADASSQISERGDGGTYDGSLTAGLKLGDRGNFVVSGGYSKRQGIKFGQLKRNSVAIDSSDLVSNGGSSNTVPTAFDVPGRGRLQVTDSGALTSNVQLYNFTPVNYAQIPLERYNAMALLRYDLTDGIEAYGRASYVRSKVQTTLAPTATAGFFFNIDPTNPFLTAAERTAFFGPTAVINDGTGVGDDPTARAGTSQVGIRRRIIETGGRIEDHTTKNYQVVGGLRGTLSNFNWDVFAQYANTKRNELLKNDLSYTALQQALDVVAGPTGARCFNPAGGCVPLNLFTTATIPQNQLAFVLRNATQNTRTTQFITGGSLGGDVGFLQSPFADKPAAIVVGGEYRRETAKTVVDDLYASGDLIYYGQGQNIAGKYNVKEGYVEVKMPLVQDKPFMQAINLEGGFRYSDYSTSGVVYTYKGGGDWSPVEGVRVRGIYQRAVRAPSIYELFSPVVAGTGSLSVDPCAGAGVSAAVFAICQAQGAPASSRGIIPQPISGQINIFTGGNVNLDAEKSDTYTVGVVVNPPSLRAFSFSVDYYNIRIANAIDTTSPFNTANQCYNIDQNATSAACSGIVRNSLDGSLSGPTNVGVPAQLGNIAVIKTDGIDVAVGYRGGDKAGFSYAASVNGTYTRSYKKQSDPTAPATQCAGRFGTACNPLEPIAKWKHVADLNLGYGPFNLLTRWRYFGKVKQDIGTDILKSKIPGFTYIDETLNLDVNDKFALRVGVQNLFDKKSPIVGDTVGSDVIAGSTFPNTYDVIGRSFFAGVSATF